MNRVYALREHLRTLPVERVADALRTLPERLRGSEPMRLSSNLSELLHRPGAVDTLTQAQGELLKVAAELAVTDPMEGGYDPAVSTALQAIGHGERLTVDWLRVLEVLDLPSDDARRAAEAAIAELSAQALTWPTGRGDHHLATGLVEQFGHSRIRPPRVSEALDTLYNVPEVRRVALALGVDPTRRRHEVQQDVVAALTDPSRLRDLFDTAPPGAKDLLKALAAEEKLLATHCFVGGPPFEVKFRFRAEGSGDPDTDWLAERGLVVPHPYKRDLAMLPQEIDEYLKERTPRPFTPHPPELGRVPVDESLVRDEGRAALLGFLGAVDRLVAEVVRAPLTMRKSGGITARDQKRIADALGQPREHTFLWIELAHRAGALVPTERALTADQPDSAWFRAGPAERLTALLRAWTELPVVATPRPGREASVPAEEEEPGVAPFRTGMLLALADLPDGYGTGISGQAEVEKLARTKIPALGPLWSLVGVAAWYRDSAILVADNMVPSAHLVREAERVGLIAHGALTPIGRALTGTNAALTEALNTLLPEVQDTVRFQGDLTATVMGTPATRLEQLLSTVADREGDGYASVWRLSATSVGRALDEGYTGDRILEELSEVAADGALPQTLEYLVKDTARAHGRIRVAAAASCVRCADPALAREMVADRSLRDLRPRLIADTVLISAKSAKETITALRSAGYMPVRENRSGDTVIERGRYTAGTGEGGQVGVPLPYLVQQQDLEACARRLTDQP
ncbi:helicase-associated domain-containing protein [Nocardiopsis oceani]